MKRDLLIVGGGYAGVMAALRARRSSGASVKVRLVSERPELIDRVRLHEHAASGRSVVVAIHMVPDKLAHLTQGAV